jgi:hypothetical protein
MRGQENRDCIGCRVASRWHLQRGWDIRKVIAQRNFVCECVLRHRKSQNGKGRLRDCGTDKELGHNPTAVVLRTEWRCFAAS